MIKETIRAAAYATAPRFVVDRYLRFRMLDEARRLGRLRDATDDASILMDSLGRSHMFRPLQKTSEILKLIEIVKHLKPMTICEIGAAGCGTTFLLAQAAAKAATIIALDLAFDPSRKAALETFALPGQRLLCLEADSHRPETARLVAETLGERSLDVLYLDGDHSYDGVKRDFELYRDLVSSNGMIVFHDIVSDYKTRYGITTTSDTGGVPKFWQEIKTSWKRVEEIVEDYEQDGYGIGILYCDDASTE
ncbi:MAG TPA: class I SAM-dependent methyltransferase [Pyrinomonadaceae bacterium]|jgi:cephalosporin hydroxylase|nr:class I SAM-dependent methyltransferase [Pyrinomonadaceae bacterium]